jgi:ABC-type bacteriocin/lantibiotic exporter with double-glycine peptidase domain
VEVNNILESTLSIKKNFINLIVFLFKDIKFINLISFFLVIFIFVFLELTFLGSVKIIFEIFINDEEVIKYTEIFNNYFKLNITSENFKLYFFFLICSISFFLSFINFLVIYIARYFSEFVNYNLQKQIIRKFLDTSPFKFIKKEQGDTLNKILFNCTNSSLIVNALYLLCRDSIIAISIYSLLLFISIKYTLAISIIFVLLFLINYFFGNRFIKRRAQLQAKQMSNLYSVCDNIINGFKIIKIFSAENLFKKKIDAVTKSIQFNNSILTASNSLPSIVIRLVSIIVIISILFFFGKNSLIQINISEIVLYFLSLYKLNQYLASGGDYIVQIFSFVPSLKIVKKEIESFKKNKDKFISYNISFEKQINFKEIEFSHQKQKKLLNISDFKINKKEIIILHGKSGSGKSTIADILSGFIEVKRITMTIDNKLIKTDNKVLIKNLGYCNQEGFVFSGSLKDNITIYEKDKFSAKKYANSLNVSGINQIAEKSFHQRLYKSFGRSLSGGQKQRINIARLVYKDPEFIILDEATSSLDDKGEDRVMEKLYKWIKKNNKTAIIMTHNKNLSKYGDNVYELNNGNIKRYN